jgi:hypothetical protein
MEKRQGGIVGMIGAAVGRKPSDGGDGGGRGFSGGAMMGRAAAFLLDERGDLVSSLGWMALMALALVLIKSIVDGGLTSYANSIFSHLDRIFNI